MLIFRLPIYFATWQREKLTLGSWLDSFGPGSAGIHSFKGASMNGKSSSSISRREFARRAAIVSALSIVPPSTISANSSNPEPALEQSSDIPSLSPESQAEAVARYQAILAVYGSRFSDTQKSDLRRLCFAAQPSLDRLRAYTIENGDSPALYLKPLVEREKKTGAAVIPRAASPAMKKP